MSHGKSYLIITFILLLLFSYFPLSVSASEEYIGSDPYISFVIPDGWSEVPLSGDREIMRAKFNYKTRISMFLYGCRDFYEEVFKDTIDGLQRSDLDENFFSVSDISYFYDIDESDVTVETFGGHKYFYFIKHVDETVTDVHIDTDVYICLRLDNGYMHVFQLYNLDHYNSIFDDFISVINSVSYSAPESSSSGLVSQSDTIIDRTDEDSAPASQNSIGFFSLASPKIILYSIAISGILAVILFILSIIYANLSTVPDSISASSSVRLSNIFAWHSAFLLSIFLLCLFLYVFFLLGEEEEMINLYNLHTPSGWIFSSIAYIVIYLIMIFLLYVSAYKFNGVFFGPISAAFLIFVIISLAFSLANVLLYKSIFYLVICLIQIASSLFAYKKALIKTSQLTKKVCDSAEDRSDSAFTSYNETTTDTSNKRSEFSFSNFENCNSAQPARQDMEAPHTSAVIPRKLKKCHFCGTLNKPDSTSCRKCLANISSTPASFYDPVKKCPSCGHFTSADLLFCSRCSADISSSKTYYKAKKNVENKSVSEPQPSSPAQETKAYTHAPIAKLLAGIFALLVFGSWYSAHKYDLAIGYYNSSNVFLIELFLTSLVYFVPAVLFRYAIIKKALSIKIALPIVILYGIVVSVVLYFIMILGFNSIIDATQGFLWWCLSYIIITKD